MLDSQAALDCGLVDSVSQIGELQEAKNSLTKKVLGNNYNAVSTFKKMVNAEMLDQRERNGEQEAVNSISCLKDEDTLNRLDAFLNKKG